MIRSHKTATLQIIHVHKIWPTARYGSNKSKQKGKRYKKGSVVCFFCFFFLFFVCFVSVCFFFVFFSGAGGGGVTQSEERPSYVVERSDPVYLDPSAGRNASGDHINIQRTGLTNNVHVIWRKKKNKHVKKNQASRSREVFSRDVRV